MRGGETMKSCKVKIYFMAGDYVFHPGDINDFEDATADSLSEAGYVEIEGGGDGKSIDELNYAELKERAGAAGFENVHGAKKDVLVQFLKDKEADKNA
jgi:hypothetical protein